MVLRPYYLAILAAVISTVTANLSISSNSKTIITLFAALLIVISISWSYIEYKKSKEDS
ncbi:hypothetical protein MOK21_04220 [Lysinibacillus sp. BPa_S21]|nr:hypothetical protein [Lysinibacillus sp. BPa_S21]